MRILPLLALAVALPVSAQSTHFAHTRTFYGCLPQVSCHWVTLQYQMGEFGHTDGVVRAQSSFAMNLWQAGYPSYLIIGSYPFPFHASSDQYWSYGVVHAAVV